MCAFDRDWSHGLVGTPALFLSHVRPMFRESAGRTFGDTSLLAPITMRPRA